MAAIKHALPFQHMRPDAWTRLGLLALAASYIIQIGFDLYWHNTCGHLAIDYCAFWSAGRIADTTGYPQIYDLTILKQVEASISPSAALDELPVSPVAYLPVFILPFQFLARLEPVVSYWLWAIANLLVLAIYLRYFVQQTSGQVLRPTLLVLFLLALPVYWNFFNGQVNVWLAICIGETLRASMSGKPLRAGLWLGGLLIKPQLLLLIVPALLLQRATRMIAGLGAACIGVLGVSWLMIGSNGFRSLIELWLGFTSGLPTNDVGMMMNWRMLGAHISVLTTPGFGWSITAAGLAVTLLAATYIWRRPIDLRSENSAVAWLGLLAGTALFAWHSHVHTAMMIIPPMMYLNARGILETRLLRYWVFLPAAMYFLAFVAAASLQANAMPGGFTGVPDFLRGAGAFGMNVVVLGWAIKKRAASLQTKS